MEVLNLKQCIKQGGYVLLRIRDWLKAGDGCPATIEQLDDAQEFIGYLRDVAYMRSTPHIYISKLAFCPRASSVYNNYWGHTRNLFGIKETVPGQLTEKSMVHTVTFSPDGNQIVSGSRDDTIRVWDAHNGNMIAGPFNGHTDSVMSVAFSPDGTHIASSSAYSERTIRVWNVCDGNMVAGPFNGHTSSVFSIAFSPNGTQIASGSGDHTVRVWDSHSGDLVAGPFNHTSMVLSVAFSPNSTQVASGCDDHTIRIWDTHSGNMAAGPFSGHTSSVWSIAFSPDGTQIVSGSGDSSIRVWDAHDGNMVAGPFHGHKGWVKSVAFSPDGTQIVSGASDRTIRVWDAHTGNMIAGPFLGHTGEVRSVAFSPDGASIASGSLDCTIRVWNVHTGSFIEKMGNTNKDIALSHSLFSNSHSLGDLLVKQYTLQDDGWITADNHLIFWIPDEFRTEVLYPGNILAITPRGVVSVFDFSKLFIGHTWSRCYH